jgi:hypothetical protein
MQPVLIMCHYMLDTWEAVSVINAKFNQAIDQGFYWNETNHCIQSYKLCYSVRLHQLLQYIALVLRNLYLLVNSSTTWLLMSPSSNVLSLLI